MAQIIVEIPDAKLPLVKAWVDSRTNAGTVEGWADSDYANYVDVYITSRLRAEIYSFQQNEFVKDNFVFDDPTA